jgi:hypothetical protein
MVTENRVSNAQCDAVTLYDKYIISKEDPWVILVHLWIIGPFGYIFCHDVTTPLLTSIDTAM